MGISGNFEQDSQGYGGPGFGGAGFGGGGIGAFGLVGLVGLLGGRRGGFGDDGGDGCNPILNAIVMNKLGDIQNDTREAQASIQSDIQASTSNLKDVTQNQTLFLQNQLAQLALGGQQGFSNTKDAVQAGIYLLSKGQYDQTAIMQEGICSIKGVVATEGDRTRALINDINRENLNRQLSDAKNEAIELRHEGRSRQFAADSSVHVSQTVNQAQAQAQQQQQQQQLRDLQYQLASFHNDFQVQKFSNKTVQVGAGNVATPVNNGQQIG